MSIDYKKIAPCMFLKGGRALKWFNTKTFMKESPVEISQRYANHGADSLIIFDLSEEDEEHEINLGVIKNICAGIDIPVIGAGNVHRLEDIKKLLYAGCRKAGLNFKKPENIRLSEEVSTRFGRDHIAACIDSPEQMETGRNEIKNYVSTLILVNEKNLDGCADWVDKACSNNANPISVSLVPVFHKKSYHELAAVLRNYSVQGVSGGDINERFENLMDFKRQCKGLGITVNTFESSMRWSDFKKNSDGMVPVIVQDYKTDEVLMLAYMNEEAYNRTIETGRMNYWSRSRNELWQKGDTSGHYQYVKSLIADCDNDTILAKVLQIGAACHTGKRSCFFNTMLKKEYDDSNPLKVFEKEYNTILDRKAHPKEGSYTNYLFDKGIDKILKKVGEECTEIIIAAKNPNPEEIKYEMADFLYHAMVLMVEKGVTWDEITKEINSR
ncbi:MAG: bifunctional phosphoribosyl-AMP cyclohydrolase/phosphoribosyl-ATP diphosphatase HisIE [Lachnospiraceae bacterium]|nr:bifunctional phosphoribosyl-AMP cyclohydrolase/phosphoribosyl-ATP diphosphatase HisIE [Lachnospiraceae bacterium]